MTKRSEASRVRRAGRLVVRVVSTILTGAVAAALIALGSGAIANRAAETPAPEPVAAPFVATAPLARADGYTVSRSFVGQVETAREIDVAFETGGTIEAITVEEGDRVSAGTVLARLDTRTLDAERTATLAGRAAVMAQLDLAERTAARAEGLGASGFASDQRVDEARATVAELNARVAEFDAAIAAIDVALDKAVLHAPFDGEIGPRSVDPGQTVAGG
ncbi:MAG: efflux RND transporter periplasmic adaptor subunit, partial [Pseudomonadota bacterium]